MFFIACSTLEATLRPMPNTASLEATYLYMRPISDFPYFASQANPVTNNFTGERFANEFAFSSGYRIEADYVLCDCVYDIRGEWTHLKTSSTRSLPLGTYIPAQMPFAIAFGTIPLTYPKSMRSIEYDALDVLWGYSFLKCASFLTINGGVHWAKINLDEQFQFLNTDMTDFARGEFSSHMHGIGPEIGLIGKWQLPFRGNHWCFLNGRIEAGILVSRVDSNLKTRGPADSVTTVIDQDVSNDDTSYVVPRWASSIGLSIEKWCPAHLSAEIGYMVLGYHQALDIIGIMEVVVPDQFVQTFDFRDDIYFHGLYITIGITY
jgi:hypothetical protein